GGFMLFLSLLDDIPKPTELRAGDRITVSRNFLMPSRIRLQVVRFFDRQEFYEVTRYCPQGQDWPKPVALLIGTAPATATYTLRLLLNGSDSMTAQITQALVDLDPALKAWHWRRMGWLTHLFVLKATFVAEHRSS
ncbi:MAG: hypothetical protein NUV56_00375, partial [Candidatus Uhrbacteria bacterium]|nr:hypothetical protein [Candidatus Uhrbacteria bacterium]